MAINKKNSEKRRNPNEWICSFCRREATVHEVTNNKHVYYCPKHWDIRAGYKSRQRKTGGEILRHHPGGDCRSQEDIEKTKKALGEE